MNQSPVFGKPLIPQSVVNLSIVHNDKIYGIRKANQDRRLIEDNLNDQEYCIMENELAFETIEYRGVQNNPEYKGMPRVISVLNGFIYPSIVVWKHLFRNDFSTRINQIKQFPPPIETNMDFDLFLYCVYLTCRPYGIANTMSPNTNIKNIPLTSAQYSGTISLPVYVDVDPGDMLIAVPWLSAKRKVFAFIPYKKTEWETFAGIVRNGIRNAYPQIFQPQQQQQQQPPQQHQYLTPHEIAFITKLADPQHIKDAYTKFIIGKCLTGATKNTWAHVMLKI